MDRQSLMVVLGDRQWTQQAMHLACAMARDAGALVIVVKMVNVNHPLLLGDAAGLRDYTREDRCLLQDCAATAEDYGVTFRLQVFAYASYVSGVVSAVEQIGVSTLFMPPLSGPLAFWNRFMLWRLRRAVHKPLYTLQTPSDQPVVVLGESVLAGSSDATFPPIAHPAKPWLG